MDEISPLAVDAAHSNPRIELMPLMTVREVAAFLKVKPSTVYRLADRQLLPAIRMGTNRRMVRFKRDDILNWLQQNRIE